MQERNKNILDKKFKVENLVHIIYDKPCSEELKCVKTYKTQFVVLSTILISFI